MSCPEDDFLMFLVACIPSAGYHVWRFRDPEFRKAYRDWMSLRDPFGVHVNAQYPGIFGSFLVSLGLAIAIVSICGY